MKEKRYGEVNLQVFPTRDEMGRAAARDAAAALRGVLARKDAANCIFASAPSQNEFLRHLVAEPGVAWERVNAFHMDEYIGVPVGDPRSFSGYLIKSVFERLTFRSVNYLDGMADPQVECPRYAALLEQHPIDVVFMGIGDNGHIAFNDPPVADFNDPKLVKEVELEQACRQQQVNDGCFPDLDAVPMVAITLTIPALLGADAQFCVVPGVRKARALRDALTGPIGVACPASALRRKRGARIYADAAAAGELGL